MNKKIVILLLTVVHWSITQAQFQDNFSDADFLTNPDWSGTQSKFIIENEQLRLLAPAESSSAYLTTGSAAIENASWEFYVKMDFNPSASNLTRVYLVSDQQNLDGNLSGYYVQLGGTDDEISLYRQSGATRTKIIDGQNGTLNFSGSQFRVRVTRNDTGKWELFSASGNTNTFIKEGEIFDTTFSSSEFFGVYCLYTSSRSTSFYFDDFVVTGEAFIPPIPSQQKDVILTEIYANPSSSNGLPNAEFIEIFNRTDQSINLNGWIFSDMNSGGTLSGQIDPGEYVILSTSTSQSEFESFGKVIGVSGFPTLNNAGDQLMLKDNHGFSIDSVNYSDDWYRDSEKRSGGWSLELIDPANPCGEGNNWTASESLVGGTPGEQNSVLANKPDLTAPVLVMVFPRDPTTLILTFNEKLHREIPAMPGFQLMPSVEITAVEFGNSALTQLVLELGSALQNSIQYSLYVSGIRDCTGNVMEPIEHLFGLPEEPDELDVVINEILFNPRPTGIDFVEIYNPTNKYFNLKNWRFGNLENDQPIHLNVISDKDLMLAPKEYKVVTADIETIISHYPNAVRHTLFSSQLPVLPDDEGSIVLLDSMNRIIDWFAYTDDLHSIFVKDDEGVSLERIAFDKPTRNPDNWKSASSVSGFATPGFLNSNSHSHPLMASGQVTMYPEIFIPITGRPDFTEIRYQFSTGGLVANVKIVNSQGVLIKQIANNAILGTEGFFRWDGDQESGSKARVGYYVVWFQLFSDDGAVQIFRKRVIIATQF